MTAISQYAARIVAVSLFALLCEMLTPDGTLKKYVKMVVGLIVLLVLASPLVRLPFYAETFTLPSISLEQADTARLEQAGADAIRRQFEHDLAGKLSADATAQCGEPVTAKVTAAVGQDGMVEGIAQITLTCGNPLKFDGLMAYVSTTYGVPKENITIQQTE